VGCAEEGGMGGGDGGEGGVGGGGGGGDCVAVVEATRVDLEGWRGTRFPQTKATTLPAGYLLATFYEYHCDSYRACVCEKGWFTCALYN